MDFWKNLSCKCKNKIYNTFIFYFAQRNMKKLLIYFFLQWLFLSPVLAEDLDIKHIFQNPSYILERDSLQSTYTCDPSYSECRVNFNLQINIDGVYKDIPTRYSCLWDFWLGDHTWEEGKCNPATITYPKWIFSTSYKVIEKATQQEVFQSVLQFVNQLPEDEWWEEEEGEESWWNEEDEENHWDDDDGWSDEDSWWDDNNDEDGNQDDEESNIPDDQDDDMNQYPDFETQLAFQSPTYLLEQDPNQNESFHCDPSKTECKVNFNLLMKISGDWKNIPTKYSCQWSFGKEDLTWEEQKCNPNTLNYPVWEFQLQYTIWEKDIPQNTYTRSFSIKNTWYQKPPSSWSNSSPVIIKEPYYLPDPIIEVQSGLDETNTCKNQDCKVNLLYTTKSSKEACVWDFWLGYTTWEEQKCNPSYVSYPKWDFTITLKIFEKWNESNLKTNSLHISNIEVSPKKPPISQESIIWSQETLLSQEEILSLYTLEIVWVLPNPVWSDDFEYIEIENIWEKELDLKWCSLDDILDGGSKPYHFTDTFLIASGEKSKIYKAQTKLNINNSWQEAIYLFCHWEIIDQLNWNFSTPEGFLITHDIFPEDIREVKKIKNSNQFEIHYQNWEVLTQDIMSFYDIIGEIMEENISQVQKRKKVFTLIENSFSQKISKQKSGIKVSWKSVPHSQLIFEIQKHQDDEEIWFFRYLFPSVFAQENQLITLSTDSLGNYSYALPFLSVWNYSTKTFFILWDEHQLELPINHTLEIDSDYLEYISTSQTNTQLKEQIYTYPVAKITLQGKLSKNKSFSWNTLTCFWVDECSVNLDGSQSVWKKLKYFWDYGWEKTFSTKNPASFTFTSPGKYIISLTVQDEINAHTSYFIVEVEWKPLKVASTPSIPTQTNNSKSNQVAPYWWETSYTNMLATQGENILVHIWLSIWLFVIFWLGSLILLKQRQII